MLSGMAKKSTHGQDTTSQYLRLLNCELLKLGDEFRNLKGLDLEEQITSAHLDDLDETVKEAHLALATISIYMGVAQKEGVELFKIEAKNITSAIKEKTNGFLDLNGLPVIPAADLASDEAFLARLEKLNPKLMLELFADINRAIRSKGGETTKRAVQNMDELLSGKHVFNFAKPVTEVLFYFEKDKLDRDAASSKLVEKEQKEQYEAANEIMERNEKGMFRKLQAQELAKIEPKEKAQLLAEALNLLSGIDIEKYYDLNFSIRTFILEENFVELNKTVVNTLHNVGELIEKRAAELDDANKHNDEELTKQTKKQHTLALRCKFA